MGGCRSGYSFKITSEKKKLVLFLKYIYIFQFIFQLIPEVWKALEAGTSHPPVEKYKKGVSFSLQPFQIHTH